MGLDRVFGQNIDRTMITVFLSDKPSLLWVRLQFQFKKYDSKYLTLYTL